MSSITNDAAKQGRALAQFRAAFERLKVGKTIHLPRGTKVSQTNVAKEAGTIPSALRRSRFPNLVAEIQEWIDEHQKDASQQSERQKKLQRRDQMRVLKDKISILREQRDEALSKLVAAESQLMELIAENQRLKVDASPTNVVSFELRSDRRTKKDSYKCKLD